jgi:hypothetical protein
MDFNFNILYCDFYSDLRNVSTCVLTCDLICDLVPAFWYANAYDEPR